MSYLRESWLRTLVLSGVMLRRRALVLLTTFNFINQTVTEQMVYTDGWIPMSHNDIYNHIRRESREYPVYFTLKPPMDYDNTLKFSQKINIEKNFRDTKETLELINEQPLDITAKEYLTDKKEVTEIDVKDNLRKDKKLWESTWHSLNNIPAAEPKISETNYNYTPNDTVATIISNTYEVTEDTDKSIATEENKLTENVGYQYKPPTIQNHNLTSTLYRTLSKYNINTHDELPNYDLSLRNKVQNSVENGYRLPLPYRYNSLNHLPVDPLLAVFLSNYGFYLPSLYGINSNYNNLYGYLASNNIHNNKPFGLYKIFSDTDSWN